MPEEEPGSRILVPTQVHTQVHPSHWPEAPPASPWVLPRPSPVCQHEGHHALAEPHQVASRWLGLQQPFRFPVGDDGEEADAAPTLPACPAPGSHGRPPSPKKQADRGGRSTRGGQRCPKLQAEQRGTKAPEKQAESRGGGTAGPRREEPTGRAQVRVQWEEPDRQVGT